MSDLTQFCGGRLSLKTTLMFGLQMVQRMRELHARRVVHLDIKPQNITIGLYEKTNLFHLIDFGLSEYFEDESQRHVDF